MRHQRPCFAEFMLKIYGRASSINVRKVLWASDEIGLAYTCDKNWGRGFRPLSDTEFKALNPLCLIPVIDDDGFILSDSNVIIRYLAAKHGRTDLLPVELQERARVERWMDWQASDCSIAWRAAVLTLAMKLTVPGGQEVVDASVRDWTANMARVNDHLAASGPYMCGATFTLADICMGLAVNRWFMTPFDKPDFPAVTAYYERLSERPTFLAHGRNGLP